MSEWREQEWRIARKGEVVKDLDNNLGRVTRSEGTLQKRVLWVEDEKGSEIYSGEPAENFQVVDLAVTSEFQLRRYDFMGYRVGSICSYKNNTSIPLEILQMDWSTLRYKMTFCLRDLREFRGEIMRTEDEDLIPVFDMGFPPVETIFSPSDSGLKYRLEINLVETSRDGWATSGSPWEFMNREDAISEVESWRARMKIRRVASVLNAEWKLQFPSWTVEAISAPDGLKARVVEVKSLNGSPGYFRTALHAAQAIKMLEPEVWVKALSSSQDSLFL